MDQHPEDKGKPCPISSIPPATVIRIGNTWALLCDGELLIVRNPRVPVKVIGRG